MSVLFSLAKNYLDRYEPHALYVNAWDMYGEKCAVAAITSEILRDRRDFHCPCPICVIPAVFGYEIFQELSRANDLFSGTPQERYDFMVQYCKERSQ